MRMLALAAVLVAGCATTKAPAPGPDARISQFEHQSQKIDESENRCITETVSSSKHQIASMAASSGAFADQQTQKLGAERDRRLLECRANADREREELSERERAVYQDRAQEEHDRNSLMMILTTSRPH
jgi:hypothetical protein